MDESKIDRMRRGLYSRKAPDIIDAGRSEFDLPKENQNLGQWNAPESSAFDVIASRVAHSAGKRHSLAKKLFSFSLGIFIISLIVAGFMFWGGANRISSKNVDIQVIGPVSVGGGQETSFEIVVKNNNNANLENVKLTLDYPKGSRKADNLGKDLSTESFALGAIPSGGEVTEKITAFLFGEKDEIKNFKATVDYEVKNSNAKFFKEKAFEISISSAPVIVTAVYPKEVNSNQEIAFTVEVTPNSSDAPDNFLVNLSYPFGFVLKGATPQATYGNNTWKFEGLRQGSKKTIILRGSLLGQDNEERVFKITAGTPNVDDPRSIGVAFVSSDESILVKKPFIGLNLSVGGATGEYVAKGSGDISSNLRVQNNIQEQLFNVIAEASLSGPAFTGSSVQASDGGFFRSIDNTIFWDKRAINSFSALEPGESEDLSWHFSPLLYQNFPKGSKPEIYMTVKVSGDRILDSGEVERVESTEQRTIKLATSLAVNQKVVRSGNNITNTGSVPPKVNNKSTYTIVWSVANSFNVASNVIVKAVLPSYVDWTGVFNSSSEKISYNPDTHEVTWNIGSLPAGTGFDTAPREAAFQVSFLPSSAQLNSEPELVGPASISGIDKVTGVSVESAAGAATTHFNDSTYKMGDEKVVQ